MLGNIESNKGLSNRKRFALMTVALFMLVGLATVSASTIEKEDGARTYASAGESVMNSETSYGYNGSGVNLENPEYGEVGSQLIRFADRYSTTDGENLTFWDRSDIPNPREISNSLCHEEQTHPDSRGLSDFNWLWGQFITHDIDHTTTQDGRTPDQDQPDTAYIPISENDEWMGFPGGLQMRFFRSIVADGTGDGDPLNQREHPNTISTWIDGSVVYGSDEGRADWLREHRAGLMKVTEFEEGDLLPQANYDEDPTTPGMSFAGFNFTNSFVAGDARANEHVALLSMHILFVREHNRLAGEILERNPDWSDEQIYQYARHINIGLIESITYNEFLPSLGIELDPYEGYNSAINPAISNEFATVAFRMGHSQIGSTMLRLDESRMTATDGHLTLREGFFDVTPITEGGGIDPILRGLAFNVQPENDLMFVDDLRNQMFGPPGAGGMDLCAIDTQRGRDHGVPDFNTVREAFGLERYTNWSDFSSDNATIEALNNTFPDVDSVDALIGMLAEDHVEDSALGETMRVIIKEQFTRLREGDRLYYGSEYSELAGIEDQIESTTLSEVILRNTKIENIQCNVFFSEQVNAEMGCSLENIDGTSDGSGNNAPSTSNSDIITYAVPLVLIILVLIVAISQSSISNENDKKDIPEKQSLNEDENGSQPILATSQHEEINQHR